MLSIIILTYLFCTFLRNIHEHIFASIKRFTIPWTIHIRRRYVNNLTISQENHQSICFVLMLCSWHYTDGSIYTFNQLLVAVFRLTTLVLYARNFLLNLFIFYIFVLVHTSFSLKVVLILSR